MSASSTPAVSLRFVRSVAMTKKVATFMLDCTVCPTSTLRLTTTPSIGDLMVQ